MNVEQVPRISSKLIAERRVTIVPVKFLRRDGMLPLPIPERVTGQASGIQEVRTFFGNLSQAHFALVIAWLVSCLRDPGVYPILMIHGESGSGKRSWRGCLPT